VVIGARAVEEAAQQRVLLLGVRVREDEPDAQLRVVGRRAGPGGLGEVARDVGDEDAVGGGGAGRRGEGGDDGQDDESGSHRVL
jgi:hypothetical protein